MISREETSKQESSSNTSDHNNINLKATSTTTSWSRLKDPRIVRVSRAFGGKDRHSKVCTVRGLRDRRVRLSVPTAIQLYDLQDRLGLNQPSKVVDWLLNAAKSEIDELPPLHFPQGSFSATLLPMLNNNNTNSDKQALISTGKSSKDDDDHVSPETREREENNWTRSNEEQQGRHDFNLGINQDDHHSYVSSTQNQNPSSLQSLMNSTPSSIPFNSFVRWDPSNLTLSHPPRSPPHHQGDHDWHNFNLSHHHHHQVLVYQPAAAAVQPYFQSQISASNAGFDAKQINFQNSHLSTSSPRGESSTLPARPVHFNMTANLLPSQNNDGRG